MKVVLIILISLFMGEITGKAQEASRPRARETGIQVGILPPGRFNAITDVEGVKAGHKTIIREGTVRTGVTVILPHGGNLFLEKVRAAVYSGNGFGKLAGSMQIEELGTIETPIALTNTLSVPVALSALIRYTLRQPGNMLVTSVNAVAGETNDGWLNDIRGMHVTESDVLEAIEAARSGPVEEGSVGAGTGTMCYGFKGGIGTSSRVLPDELGDYTVGVLVQTNFGGVLTINGAPVGRELGDFQFSEYAGRPGEDGSCMIVVATDAPVSSHDLKRMAKRAIIGLGRTGSSMSNGSGDFVIAFSTACRIPHKSEPGGQPVALISGDRMSPLFLAVTEATEEAIYNSLLKATEVTGRAGHKGLPIPVEKVKEICRKYNVLDLQDHLPAIKAGK
ncbi:MAG: P1 family peptidase [Bacteroidales bacterium]|jgi:D-aminopeptidase|nr:P1 family peptidase [Bacteroidales bacterium]